MIDLIVRNARIIDGTGNPWFLGDLGVIDGRLVAVGRVEVDARTTVDARGRVAAPGFVDVHTHVELALLADPQHESAVRQGVTTVLLGLDGLSYAPLSPANLELWRRYMAGLCGNPDIAWDWRSVAEFLARFDRRCAVNVAYLAPHGAIRTEAVGWANRRATPSELAAMRRLLAEALEDGAVGLSAAPEYYPGSAADTEEFVELCKVAARYGGLFVTSAVRGAGLGRGGAPARNHASPAQVMRETYAEAVEVARRADVPLHVAHFIVPPPWTMDEVEGLLALLEAARREGLDVTTDSHPYEAGSSTLVGLMPHWAIEGGPDALLARLADPALRPRLRAELAARALRWERQFLCGVGTTENRHLEGMAIAAAAREAGTTPEDFVCDLLLGERLEVAFQSRRDVEEQIRRVLRHPLQMIASDATLVGSMPNPRGFGTFPRCLGLYSRRLGLLSLEETVRKMTSFPARRLGLGDRGLLRPGMAADVVIFDPDRVRDTATFERPRQQAEGIDWVITNGEVVLAEGRLTGALPGRALRRRAARV